MTDKQLLRFWESQPGGPYTCTGCGRVGGKAYVQPQPSGGALCGNCISAHNQRGRASRKAELAALPRCSVPGCTRRGTWRWAGRLFCGRHLKQARAKHAASRGIFGLFG